MRSLLALVLVVLGAGTGGTALAAPPSAKHEKPAVPATWRRLAAGELAELARGALASSNVRLPKGAKVTAARPSTEGEVLVPIAPTRITIDLTPPARRVGKVVTAAVLVFWKDADIVARTPLRLDLTVPPEAMVFDVPKGGVVTLVVRRGLVEVSTPAITSVEADVGDVVQVLLRPSGRALRAEIVAPDRAIAVEDGR
jgi:hypothetical protein